MNNEAAKRKRKQVLLNLSKNHQKALYHELNVSSDRVFEFGKNMAIIGGVLYVGYTVLDRFLDTKLKSQKNKTPGKLETLNKMILPILAMALQQGSTILLKRARNMLVEYLAEKRNDDV
jgi:hypothetical protein